MSGLAGLLRAVYGDAEQDQPAPRPSGSVGGEVAPEASRAPSEAADQRSHGPDPSRTDDEAEAPAIKPEPPESDRSVADAAPVASASGHTTWNRGDDDIMPRHRPPRRLARLRRS